MPRGVSARPLTRRGAWRRSAVIVTIASGGAGTGCDDHNGRMGADASDRVLVDVGSDGVALVRLNRPEKRNALDGALFSAIARAGEALMERSDVRAVVLTGAGPSFCAGLDFSSMAALAGGTGLGDADDSPGAMQQRGITHLGQQVAWVWHEVPVPVIAAVSGHALGGGFQIALGADVRIVHPDTQLSVREVYWGLIPDMTGTFVLSRLVRPDVARELTYTARVFDGREALSLGIATRLSDDPLADAMTLARSIAANSPDAVRGAKSLFNRLDDAGAAEQFAEERRVIGSLIGRPNQVEAVAAGMEKRPALYCDPGSAGG